MNQSQKQFSFDCVCDDHLKSGEFHITKHRLKIVNQKSKISALFKILKYGNLPQLFISNLFIVVKSVIQSQFHYFPLIWMFCNRNEIKIIDKVNEHSSCSSWYFILNNKEVNLKTLYFWFDIHTPK